MNRLEPEASGSMYIVANKGIRRGSPESAELCGILMTLAVEYACADPRWPKFRAELSDLPVEVVVYQDDVFLWDGDPTQLEQKIAAITAEHIARLGLSLSPAKTAVPGVQGRLLVILFVDWG